MEDWQSELLLRFEDVPPLPGSCYSRLFREMLTPKPPTAENIARAAALKKILEYQSLGPQLGYNPEETHRRTLAYVTRYKSRLEQGLDPHSEEDSQSSDTEAVERLEEYVAVRNYYNTEFFQPIPAYVEEQFEADYAAGLFDPIEVPFDPLRIWESDEAFECSDNGELENEENMSFEDSVANNAEPVSELLAGMDLEAFMKIGLLNVGNEAMLTSIMKNQALQISP